MPDALYATYVDALVTCLSQPPAPPAATAAATAAATSEAATPSAETPAATLTALDCNTRFVRWLMNGLPGITDAKELSAAYNALLACFEPKAQVNLCNLPDLVKLHQAIQASGKPLSADDLRTNKKTVLGCFGNTPVLLVGFGGEAAGGSGLGGGAGNGGGNGGDNGASNGGSESGATPQPTESGEIIGGPYVVKQTRSLGGEKINGVVCSLTQPFTVNAATSKVAWTFLFTPADAAHGAMAYNYNIPSAGESHAATGTYTISAPAPDGSLTLTMSVRDHVVFKGFDGVMPLQYSFALVPTAGAPCPNKGG